MKLLHFVNRYNAEETKVTKSDFHSQESIESLLFSSSNLINSNPSKKKVHNQSDEESESLAHLSIFLTLSLAHLF